MKSFGLMDEDAKLLEIFFNKHNIKSKEPVRQKFYKYMYILL